MIIDNLGYSHCIYTKFDTISESPLLYSLVTEIKITENARNRYERIWKHSGTKYTLFVFHINVVIDIRYKKKCVRKEIILQDGMFW